MHFIVFVYVDYGPMIIMHHGGPLITLYRGGNLQIWKVVKDQLKNIIQIQMFTQKSHNILVVTILLD
jgi:predicted oxidoreductase (fatty acid repression mutant protein)